MANREQQASIDALNLIASGAARVEQLPELMEQHPLVLSHFAREAGLRNNERQVVYNPQNVVNTRVSNFNPARSALSTVPPNSEITITGLPNALVYQKDGGAFENTEAMKGAVLGSMPDVPDGYLLQQDLQRNGIFVQEDHIPLTVTAVDWRSWGRKKSGEWNIETPGFKSQGTQSERSSGRSVFASGMTGNRLRTSESIELPSGKRGSILTQQETFAGVDIGGQTEEHHFVRDESFVLSAIDDEPVKRMGISIKGKGATITGRNKIEKSQTDGFMGRRTTVGRTAETAIVEPQPPPRTLFKRLADRFFGPKPEHIVHARAEAKEVAVRDESVRWGSRSMEETIERQYQTSGHGESVQETLPYVGPVVVKGKGAKGSAVVHVKESGWYQQVSERNSVQTAGGWTTEQLEATITAAVNRLGTHFSAGGVEARHHAEAYSHNVFDFDKYGNIDRQEIKERATSKSLLGPAKTPHLFTSMGGQASLSGTWDPEKGLHINEMSVQRSVPGAAALLLQTGILRARGHTDTVRKIDGSWT